MQVLRALIKKEFFQIIRDPSSITIAFVLPFILLFIYMYGINLDTTKINIGILNENPTPTTIALADSFNKSKYINAYLYPDRKSMYQDLTASRLRGLLVIPGDFEAKIKQGLPAPLQIITDGSEVNTANYVGNYITSIATGWLENTFIPLTGGTALSKNTITLSTSVWYNPELNSHYCILPGSLAITMTLIGILLTALVVAREWERGTMEAMLALGVSRLTLVLSKYIPYYILGMLSMAFNIFMCVAVFAIPFRGSYLILFCFSSLFLLTCLGIGLLVSSKFKNQFTAGQAAFVIGFMPALLLSGLMFPISSMPAIFQYLTHIIPARHFVVLLQNEFLVGTNFNLFLTNSAFLLALALLLFTIVYKNTSERL